MKNGMDERREDFEKKLEIDEEMRLKDEESRKKIMGIWVEESIGKKDEEEEEYEREVVEEDFEEDGDEDVLRKVSEDMEEEGVRKKDEEIRKKMLELMEEEISKVKKDWWWFGEGEKSV